MRFKIDKAQAILVDAQEKLSPFMSNHIELEHNIVTLIKGFNLLKTPLVISEQYIKGLGMTLSSISNELVDYKQTEKSHFSCADNENLLHDIISNKRNQIILFGIEAHVCVMQTAIDLIDKGYNVCVVIDAIGSRSEKNKEIAIERMKQEGIFVTSVESILFELCRDSKNEVFKQISSLIK